MPRKKGPSSPFGLFDDDLDEDASSQSSKNDNPPVQRNAANARERARMRVLSSAFGRLKTKLPNIPPDTKLSKLDTLRLATMYIKQLKTLVEGGASNGENVDINLTTEQCGVFGLQHGTQSMSWPFGFHHIQSTNRQLSFPYSSMDWNNSDDNLPKCQRVNAICPSGNGNPQQLHQHWYLEDSPLDVAASQNSCVFSSLSQHTQNQRVHQTLQHLNQHRHPNTQTSTR